MKRLEDRVAVVTGGGGGIGRATCLALAAKGCHVAVVDVSPDGAAATVAEVERLGRRATAHHVDVRDADAAAETVAEVERLGRRATAHQTDVRDLDAMTALADEVVARHGGCNVVVNNAGVTSAGSFEDEPMDDVRWIVDINV
jgi:NAD(P)-dependent dehydrogenase (short-subunit alcohol dehydrogenase family)